MSYQEKRTVISIIATVVVFTFYCFYIFSRIAEGTLTMNGSFKEWGTVILFIIVVSIVANIVIHILFAIGMGIATKGKETLEEEPQDERDKIIDLKGYKIAYTVVGVGFALSMAFMVMGFSIFYFFNMMFLSFNIAEIVSSICKLRYYKRGF